MHCKGLHWHGGHASYGPVGVWVCCDGAQIDKLIAFSATRHGFTSEAYNGVQDQTSLEQQQTSLEQQQTSLEQHFFQLGVLLLFRLGTQVWKWSNSCC